MRNKEVISRLAEVTIDVDCMLTRYFGPIKMRTNETRKVYGLLQKKGGIRVEKQGSVRGSNAYIVNSKINTFLLRTSLGLPIVNLCNVLNHCKIEIYNREDRYCKKCRIHIDSNSCTKRKVEPFLKS